MIFYIMFGKFKEKRGPGVRFSRVTIINGPGTLKGFNSFTDNMLKLLAHKIIWIGLLVMIHDFLLDI